MIFYLGTHKPQWFGRTDVPLFISARRLRERVRLPVATGPWALDSGAFSELQQNGCWLVSEEQYAFEVRLWQEKIGKLAWAAPQDWMCEPIVINGGRVGNLVFKGTHLSIREHQDRTVRNYLRLREVAPDLPWIPVLQGWSMDDYLRCLELYGEVGIDLRKLPLVGLGTVCRRQGTKEAEEIVTHLAGLGLKIHAFGFKMQGLENVAGLLTSADSMAWSYSARKRKPLPGCKHKNCANCLKFALDWQKKVLDGMFI